MIIDKRLLDEVSVKAKNNRRLRINLNFHDTLDSKVQRLLNVLEPGTIFSIHRHQETSETYLLHRGRTHVIFYNSIGEGINSSLLEISNRNYGMHVLRDTGIYRRYW